MPTELSTLDDEDGRNDRKLLSTIISTGTIIVDPSTVNTTLSTALGNPLSPKASMSGLLEDLISH